MLVVTVNAGSTSVRLAAYDAAHGSAPRRIAAERCAGADLDPTEVLGAFFARLTPRTPAVVSHRVVHGGERFTAPVRIDAAVEREIEALAELAPLHNPAALRWIAAAKAASPPQTAQVAAFDTAWFAHLPRVAAEYAIPERYGARLGVRRYGFHGIAHEALWRRWCELRPDLPRGGRLVTLQLGGGSSAAAVDRGAPLDCSMGFSPLEGLVMATRSGDVDPAAVPYLAARLGWTCDRVVEMLNRESGLLGVSQRSSEMSALLADDSDEARFAVELYCQRARKCVGAFLAVLGGCDGIVFGGGVGEHVPEVRARILSGMEWAGIALDPHANAAAVGVEARLDAAASRVSVYVIPVDEESSLAAAALACSPPPAG